MTNGVAIEDLEKSYFKGLENTTHNVFYGDFCIIQVLKGLIYPLSHSNFELFSTEKKIIGKY